MSAEPLARDLVEVYHEKDVQKVRAAISIVPVCAEVAALHGKGGLINISSGTERDYLARYPIGVLEPSLALSTLLDGIGIECCADLARLDLESVEVRFGAEGARLWRLSRADDSRRIFTFDLAPENGRRSRRRPRTVALNRYRLGRKTVVVSLSRFAIPNSPFGL